MTSLDTLKQAAQALRDEADDRLDFIGEEYKKLAAALEAMAEQKPVFEIGFGWLDDPEKYPRGTNLYAAPIATPEHDAKVRDAALEEAARCADAHSGRPVAGEVMAHAIRYLKSTGADHE